MKDIVSIKLNVRALRCRGQTTSDTHSYGRLAIDFSAVDPNATDQGFQVSVILASFADIPSSERATNEVLNDGADRIDPTLLRPTLHLQGKNWGVKYSSSQQMIFNDTSPNCGGQLDGIPFVEVEVPVRSILNGLVAQGKLKRALVDTAKYSHGTILGLEQWGRSHFTADVAGRVILVGANGGSAPGKPEGPAATQAQSTSTIPASSKKTPAGQVKAKSQPGGYFVLPSGARYYSNGTNAFCWFLGAPPPGFTLTPTQLDPIALSLRNDGRCSWDVSAH